MVRRRHLFFTSLCFLAILSVGVVVALWNARSARVTKPRYEQIELGMQIEQAERILGMNREESRDRGFILEYDWPNVAITPANFPNHVFADDNACILVWVDRNDIIVAKEFGARREPWMDFFRRIPGCDLFFPRVQPQHRIEPDEHNPDAA